MRRIQAHQLTHIHGQRFTNLGAGFQADIGGQTTLTINRQSADRSPVIVWANTYGNVYSAKGKYELTAKAQVRAEAILRNIETAHAERTDK